MFIVLGVAWACALGPGIARSLSQRGLSLNLSLRKRDRSPMGFSAANMIAGSIGNLRGRRSRRSNNRSSVARPSMRLSPAARRTRKRRRELLAGLSSVAFGSLLLGLVPGLRMLLVLSAVSMSLLAMYVVALVRLKAAAPLSAIAPIRSEAFQYAYNRVSGE